MIIADEILDEANMSESELKSELAILLYQKGKLSMGQAARLAELDRISFQFLLASRQIPLNYDKKEFQADLNTLTYLDTKRR